MCFRKALEAFLVSVGGGKLLHALRTNIQFWLVWLQLVYHQVLVVLTCLPLVFLMARSVLQVVAVLAVDPS